MSSSPVDTVQPFPGVPFIPAPAADKPDASTPSPELPSTTDVQPSLPGLPWFPSPLGDVHDEPAVSPRSSSSADNLPSVVDDPNEPDVSIQPFPGVPFVPNPVGDDTAEPAASLQPPNHGVDWIQALKIDMPEEPVAVTESSNPGVPWIQALEVPSPDEKVTLSQPSNPGVDWIQALVVDPPSTGGIHATPSGLHPRLANATTSQPSTGTDDLSGSHTLAVVGLALSIFAYVFAAGVNANLKTKQRYPDTAPNQPGAKFRPIWFACYFAFYLTFMPVITLWGIVQALVAGALLIGQHIFKRETRRADWVFRVVPIQLPRGTFTREGNSRQDVLPRHEYPGMSPRLVAQEVEGADARICATNPFPTLTKVGKVWVPKSRA
ncbi:hypothetical protein AB5N19_10658 [Seiridium cardinale]|uniref:Uncharacterized protein n=1 Tax=Seiridium cardinale TaxID=138064 RepID=A0ABR2XSW5_9PEZI